MHRGITMELPAYLNRRGLLQRSALGIGGMALSAMLGSESRANETADRSIAPLAPRGPHFQPKAKRVIHLFMNGGPSHLDTFDPKPLLNKNHGKVLPRPNLPTERKTGAAFGSPFKFSRHGQSGLEISFQEALSLERELQQQLFQSGDAKEGLDAYVSKRTAEFKGK